LSIFHGPAPLQGRDTRFPQMTPVGWEEISRCDIGASRSRRQIYRFPRRYATPPLAQISDNSKARTVGYFSRPPASVILRPLFSAGCNNCFMTSLNFLDLDNHLQTQTPQQILQFALEEFENIALSFSGAEDVVLVDMATKIRPDVSVFCL